MQHMYYRHMYVCYIYIYIFIFTQSMWRTFSWLFLSVHCDVCQRILAGFPTYGHEHGYTHFGSENGPIVIWKMLVDHQICGVFPSLFWTTPISLTPNSPLVAPLWAHKLHRWRQLGTWIQEASGAMKDTILAGAATGDATTWFNDVSWWLMMGIFFQWR
jgi:hypothetical protein